MAERIPVRGLNGPFTGALGLVGRGGYAHTLRPRVRDVALVRSSAAMTDDTPAAGVVNALIRAANDLQLDLDLVLSGVEPDSLSSRLHAIQSQGYVVIRAAEEVLDDDGAGIDPTWRGAALDGAWVTVARAGDVLKHFGEPLLAIELAERVPGRGF